MSTGASAQGARAQQVAEADLLALSIEQMANVEITSVSNTSQSLSTAAAAIHVISHDDVIRSGANSADQNFPDKLLVVIDGHSVYFKTRLRS